MTTLSPANTPVRASCIIAGRKRKAGIDPCQCTILVTVERGTQTGFNLKDGNERGGEGESEAEALVPAAICRLKIQYPKNKRKNYRPKRVDVNI